MHDPEEHPGNVSGRQPRSTLARAGVTALNLASPGLGLICLGELRSGILWMLAPLVLIAIIALGVVLFPVTSYARALAALVALLASAAALYVVPMIVTWRRNRLVTPRRWWSRWYSLVALAVIVGLGSQAAVELIHRWLVKPYYAPAESMAPTINKGDKFIVRMGGGSPPSVGEVVVFTHDGIGRVSRVAALGGDRVAMRGGVPVINGRPAVQRQVGSTIANGALGAERGRLFSERLPGEAGAHEVLDLGASRVDEAAEVRVPAGSVFVLGDNRDRSADSRVPAESGGVEMVPVAAIIGRPMYIHWSADRARIGRRVNP